MSGPWLPITEVSEASCQNYVQSVPQQCVDRSGYPKVWLTNCECLVYFLCLILLELVVMTGDRLGNVPLWRLMTARAPPWIFINPTQHCSHQLVVFFSHESGRYTSSTWNQSVSWEKFRSCRLFPVVHLKAGLLHRKRPSGGALRGLWSRRMHRRVVRVTTASRGYQGRPSWVDSSVGEDGGI